jgi:hypothetical protein
LSAEELDPDETNNRVVEVTQIKRLAELEVQKCVWPAMGRVGKPHLYKLVVRNHGFSVATGVGLVDSRPSDLDVRWLWTRKGRCELSKGELICLLGCMVPGQWVFVFVAGRPRKEGTHVYTVRVDGNAMDRNGSNNTARVTRTR